uniref:UPAR/Ly6 domain-containing protein n=1 Tax=Oryzias sinensis TaxID=183150 RepID=A0A8C7ZF54_9TELE
MAFATCRKRRESVRGHSIGDTQICSRTQNACAAVIFQGALNRSFRQCMNMAVCQGYISTPGILASCCSSDLCN